MLSVTQINVESICAERRKDTAEMNACDRCK